MDQKIKFYDYHEKTCVKTLEVDEPVTALDFFSDGCTIAYGTLYGIF